MKHIGPFAIVIGVVLLLLAPSATNPTAAHPSLQTTVTPTVFEYLPLVARHWEGRPIVVPTAVPHTATPTPTATHTPTSTPTPTMTPTPSPSPSNTPEPTPIVLANIYPCVETISFGTQRRFLTENGCPSTFQVDRLMGPDSPREWAAPLLLDIAGGDYTFDLLLDAYGTETIEAKIIHKHGETQDVLADFTIEVSGSMEGPPSRNCVDLSRTFTRVTRTVPGPDPNVTLETDEIILQLSSLTGDDACFKYGDFMSKIVVPFVAPSSEVIGEPDPR